jgi:hypothetical protein
LPPPGYSEVDGSVSMIGRHKRIPERNEPLGEPDPVVYDVDGVPVGVRIGGTERHDEDTPAARHLARVTALRQTRELEGREWLTLGLF